MYKVFVFDKLIILSGGPVTDNKYAKIRQVEVSTRQSIKLVYTEFINTPAEHSVILYNNENEKRLLEEFISLFWYVEAAGGMVYNATNERLFIHRFGRWDLPKGKIEKNERHTDAAIREVQEETGLMEVEITGEMPSTFHVFDHKGKKVLKRTYWFTMKYTGNSEPKPQEEEEITAAIWIPDSKVPEVLENTYASLRSLLDDFTRDK